MNDDHKPSDQAFSYAFQHTYVKESCALYAFGILVIALRLSVDSDELQICPTLTGL